MRILIPSRTGASVRGGRRRRLIAVTRLLPNRDGIRGNFNELAISKLFVRHFEQHIEKNPERNNETRIVGDYRIDVSSQE